MTLAEPINSPSRAEGRDKRLFDGDLEVFAKSFEREVFRFKHRLAGNPLFGIKRLARLIKAQQPHDLYYDSGDIKVDQRWDQTPPSGLSVEEMIERIEHAGAWIIIKRAETDPEYREILEDSLSELRELTAYDEDHVKVRNAIIFVSSPNRIATYHIDRECNFILQIQGSKQISVFDRNDREVLSEEEIEQFWTVDNNAAVYKPYLEDHARVFDLAPGSGIHVPVNSPHWVRNGNEVSVTLSINFQFLDRLRADLYRANYHLRRSGLHPSPPGRSRVRDFLKLQTYHGLRAASALIAKVAPKSRP
jgi:hypothetical protein